MDDYIDQVAAHIHDPHRAGEVRRELKAHLEDSITHLEAQGYDRQTAEAMAVQHMGAPGEAGRELGLIHHRHLPWRYYLSVIPLCGLTATVLFIGGNGRLVTMWLYLIVVCLFPQSILNSAAAMGRRAILALPGLTTGRTLAPLVRWLKHRWTLLTRDPIAKWHWLRPHLHMACLAWGLLTGVLGGLAWGYIFPAWEAAHRIWPDYFAQGFPPDGLILGIPVLVSLLIITATFRWHRAPFPVLAALAAASFPFGFVTATWTAGSVRVSDLAIRTAVFTLFYFFTLLSSASIGLWVFRKYARRAMVQ